MYMKCSQGHVFGSNFGKNLMSVHLGPKKLQHCPVCHKMRLTSRISENSLTADQLARLERGEAV